MKKNLDRRFCAELAKTLMNTPKHRQRDVFREATRGKTNADAIRMLVMDYMGLKRG